MRSIVLFFSYSEKEKKIVPWILWCNGQTGTNSHIIYSTGETKEKRRIRIELLQIYPPVLP